MLHGSMAVMIKHGIVPMTVTMSNEHWAMTNEPKPTRAARAARAGGRPG